MSSFPSSSSSARPTRRRHTLAALLTAAAVAAGAIGSPSLAQGSASAEVEVEGEVTTNGDAGGSAPSPADARQVARTAGTAARGAVSEARPDGTPVRDVAGTAVDLLRETKGALGSFARSTYDRLVAVGVAGESAAEAALAATEAIAASLSGIVTVHGDGSVTLDAGEGLAAAAELSAELDVAVQAAVTATLDAIRPALGEARVATEAVLGAAHDIAGALVTAVVAVVKAALVAAGFVVTTAFGLADNGVDAVRVLIEGARTAARQALDLADGPLGWMAEAELSARVGATVTVSWS